MPEQPKTVTIVYHDIDRHGAGCTCGDCDPNGKSYGYAIFDLGPFGVTHQFMLTDEICDALKREDPLDVVYGPSEDAAYQRTAGKVVEQGWRLPEQRVSRDQLLAALVGLVGENGYVTRRAVCECDDTHTQNYTMCRICWARAVYSAAQGRGDDRPPRLAICSARWAANGSPGLIWPELNAISRGTGS